MFDLKLGRRATATLLSIFGVVCLVMALVSWQHLDQGARVNALRDHARKMGFPIDRPDLVDWYPAPAAEDNAATLLMPFIDKANRAAIDSSPEVFAPESYCESDGPLSKEAIAAWLAFALEHRELLDALYAASDKSQCRFPLDIERGDMVPVPWVHLVNLGTRMLLKDAVVAAEQGRTDDCAKALLAGASLGRTIQNEPRLLSWQAGVTSHNSLFSTYCRSIRRVRFTELELTEMGNVFAIIEQREPLVRAIAAERVISCTSDSQLADSVELPFQIQILSKMEDYTKLLEHVMTTPYSRYGAIAGLPGDPCARAAVSLLPSQVRLVAQMRLAATSVAIERHRIAHGSLPNTLEELAPSYLPDIPRDPANDWPIR